MKRNKELDVFVSRNSIKRVAGYAGEAGLFYELLEFTQMTSKLFNTQEISSYSTAYEFVQLGRVHTELKNLGKKVWDTLKYLKAEKAPCYHEKTSCTGLLSEFDAFEFPDWIKGKFSMVTRYRLVFEEYRKAGLSIEEAVKRLELECGVKLTPIILPSSGTEVHNINGEEWYKAFSELENEFKVLVENLQFTALHEQFLKDSNETFKVYFNELKRNKNLNRDASIDFAYKINKEYKKEFEKLYNSKIYGNIPKLTSISPETAKSLAYRPCFLCYGAL